MWPLILEAGLKILERVIPDPQAKAAAQMELLKMQQAGDLATMANELETARLQTDVNKEQAKSADPFTSRARPFIMWMCGCSLGYAAIIDPFARFIAAVVYHYPGPFPAVDTTITLQILLGLLGLGGMRTLEKTKGVAR